MPKTQVQILRMPIDLMRRRKMKKKIVTHNNIVIMDTMSIGWRRKRKERKTLSKVISCSATSNDQASVDFR